MTGKTLTLSMPNFASRSVLMLLAAMHWLLLAGFLLSLASAGKAWSAGVSACSGADLVAQLAAENPAALDEIKRQADVIENGKSVFWKISMPGKPDSWLLGTMHSPDPRIARLEPKVADALAASSKVLIENTDALDPAKMQAAVLRLKHLAFLPPGKSIETLVAQDALPPLKEQAASHSIPWPVANRMQPWMLAAAIAQPSCEAASAGQPVLDKLVATTALSSGKSLEGLETVDDQFNAVAALPQAFHVNALADLVALGDLADDVMETTKLLYLQGDIAMILPLARHFSPKAYDGEGYADFQDRLITRRNIGMAERAQAHLAEGGVFIAVGAMHLPGEQGLVALLRKAGYTLESVAQQ
jgi:hypothetical protein